jgi:hypothetical protein
MTQQEFYEVYRKHDGDRPKKTPLKYDGYELRYENGDIYRHEENLIPGHTPDWNGYYGMDDFTYKNTWNGEQIA